MLCLGQLSSIFDDSESRNNGPSRCHIWGRDVLKRKTLIRKIVFHEMIVLDKAAWKLIKYILHN